ncbi:MAG: hypothetical protein ACYTGX_10150 [Planctomycetota bacterium]|jgi:hypothetical protein
MGSETTTGVFMPAIEEVLEKGARTEESDWCATFEVPGRESAWAQVTADCINLSYPLTEDPADALPVADLLPPFISEILAWQAEQHVTLQFERATARAIAGFLDRYFRAFLVPDAGDYAVTARVEDLG